MLKTPFEADPVAINSMSSKNTHLDAISATTITLPALRYPFNDLSILAELKEDTEKKSIIENTIHKINALTSNYR